MKPKNLQKRLLAMAVTGLALGASSVLAQDSSAASAAQPAAVYTPAPQLPYAVSQVVRLQQAKVGEDTIIAYVKSSGASYPLDANQIIYLRQQGISDAVITMMLNQPRPLANVATPATPAPQVMAATAPAPVPTATVAPTVTYVQTVPATTVYYQPYYQPYYYPSYTVFPAVSFSFGWGGGWHGGGGWHH